MQPTSPLLGSTPMKDILASYPAAKRALFSEFHIGGCQSCAYADHETLEDVCERNSISLEDAIQTIESSHLEAERYFISPSDLHKLLTNSNIRILLIDTRTREEHEAVSIQDSIFLTEEKQTELFANPPSELIIFYDHRGDTVLDTCSWFVGHGIKSVKALSGGIDSYSTKCDPSLPRYRLELS